MSDLFDGVDSAETDTNSAPVPPARPEPNWSLVASLKLAAILTIAVFLAYPVRPLLGIPTGSPYELWAETLILFWVFLFAVSAGAKLSDR